jgi:hypothetical protein
MTNTTQTQIINGQQVTIGEDQFPWIQINNSPKYFVDTDGDHWGSIGIDNPEDFKDTILSQFIELNEDTDVWTFDMGGMFCTIEDDGHWSLIDEDELILKPLGFIDNGEGMYGNG